MSYETSAIVRATSASRLQLFRSPRFQDINSMAVLLVGVRESILRQHLREGDMGELLEPEQPLQNLGAAFGEPMIPPINPQIRNLRIPKS
jgi:hypothetical protein